MRIIQINANYGFGSTGLIMRDIGSAISEAGNEAFFAYQRCNVQPTNGFVIGTVLDWKCHALLCRFMGRQGFYSTLSTKMFLKKLDNIKPDVVHLHNLHSNYINIEKLLRYLSENDIPTVITMHDCWYFTGKCFHYIDCGCDKFITGCGNCPKRLAPPASRIFDTSAKDWNVKNDLLHKIPRLAIVGCSKWITEEARKGFLKDCNLSYIYNGVDTNIFKPKHTTKRRKYGISEEEFVVLGMANKWLQDRNYSIIPKLKDIPNVKILVMGCTEDQVRKLEVEHPEVIAIGFVMDREEISEFYNMADVFVNLTHADTLPTVNMESICCGTPVITYNVSGSPELILDGTGFVVGEDDHNGVIEAIKTIQSSPMSNCHIKGMDSFDKNICYRKYVELYKSLLV